MFTNDIIGNTLGGNGVRDRRTLRVFSEGVPSNEKPEEANVRRGVGGENDSASRQLARFIRETGERYVPGMKRVPSDSHDRQAELRRLIVPLHPNGRVPDRRFP